MHKLWPSLLAGLLAGCGSKPALPPPGAQHALFHLWREVAAPPIQLACAQVEHDAETPDLVWVTGLRVRIPLRDGVLLVEAERGRFGTSREARLELDGPVRFQGRLAGAPLLGTAASATVEGGRRELRLTRIELLHRGQLTTLPGMTIPEAWQDRAIDYQGELISRPAPPAALAALAALPADLTVPELTRTSE